MRHTELWQRLEAVLGESYAPVWADQQSITALNSRTVRQALSDGVSPKQVWAAVWQHLELPEGDR